MALTPLPERLRGWRVVLGSASPRRRDILGLTRLPFEATPSSYPEDLDPAHFRNPRDFAVETARGKALDVGRGLRRGRGLLRRLLPALRKPLMVIAADTIVVLDGLILGKPKDEDDAVWMLKRLSGRQHSVITGVAVALYPGHDRGNDPDGDPDGNPDGDPEVRTFWEETRVTFSPLSDAVVRDYVATGEPMDKAGAYGIQGLGAVLAERVEGDVLNAAGFPLNRFCRELAAIFPDPDSGAVTPDPGAATPDDPAATPDDPGSGDVTPGGGAAADVVGGASGSDDPALDPEAPPPRAVTAWYVTPSGFPRGLLEVIDGFKDSQVLFAACRLGLFDLLSDAEPRGVAEVAARVGGAWAEGAGPPAAWVGSLMEACVGLGLLQRADGGFLAAPAARRHLRADSARPLRGYVRSLDRGGWADARALGRGPQRPRSPGSQADADAAELELEALMADEVLATFDLGRYRAIAQVGGGSLALLLARATPQAHVTPVGDPARDPLPPADLYVLGGLAWAERDLDDLLRRVAAALAPGGAVLLTEGPTQRQPLSLLGSTFDPPTPPGGRGPRWSDPGPRARLRRLGFRDVRVTSPGRLPPAVLAARGDP